jgi:hypothetical protein
MKRAIDKKIFLIFWLLLFLLIFSLATASSIKLSQHPEVRAKLELLEKWIEARKRLASGYS